MFSFDNLFVKFQLCKKERKSSQVDSRYRLVLREMLEGLTENFEVEVRASWLRDVVVGGAAAQLGACQGPRDAGGGEGGHQEGGRGDRHGGPQDLASS